VRGHGRDILWAYVVSFVRVASWVVVYGLLYRRAGETAAALLALVRWTLGLVQYASAGLAPAILHYAATAEHSEPQGRSPLFTPRSVYRHGVVLSWIGATVGLIALWAWSLTQGQARGVATLVALFGTGMLIDLAADAWGAVIQSRGHPAADYQAQTGLETCWAAFATLGLLWGNALGVSWQAAVGGGYLLAAVISTIARATLVHRLLRDLPPDPQTGLDATVAKRLLAFGGLVVLAQVADFLYAPTDFLLIQWLIDLKTVAVYAPAVQFDAGISLLVGGLSVALLPISASAFGRGDLAAVRRHYLTGTLYTLLALIVVSFLAWLAAPAIFKFWLGSKMRPTRAILPLVLVHTVVGGSAAVGRSILFAMGKVKAYTLAVLIAGAVNVVLSYCFVVYGGLGLRGIILGTIVVVVARCAMWMPWYVLRVTRVKG
jgi:O-antigen/teichoic acid export membrane protein